MKLEKLHSLTTALALTLAIASPALAGEQTPAYLSTHTDPDQVLFYDPMTSDWQDNWFLDGENGTLTHTREGLIYAAGTYMYPDMDNRTYEQRVEMSKHHTILWTKESFEGDVIVSFECTRLDTSSFGVNIVYLQAQGIGRDGYLEDIYEWRDQRKVASMGTYSNYMNLLHISYNVGGFTAPSYIRARRYPQNDDIGLRWGMTPLKPDYDDEGAIMLPGKKYIVEIEKTDESLVFRIFDGASKKLLKECPWDTTQIPELMEPKVIKEGRIGLRQMSTKENVYKNFRVLRK